MWHAWQSAFMLHSCALVLIKNSTKNCARKVSKGFPGTCKFRGTFPGSGPWPVGHCYCFGFPGSFFGVGPSGADDEPLRFRWALGGRGLIYCAGL